MTNKSKISNGVDHYTLLVIPYPLEHDSESVTLKLTVSYRDIELDEITRQVRKIVSAIKAYTRPSDFVAFMVDGAASDIPDCCK